MRFSGHFGARKRCGRPAPSHAGENDRQRGLLGRDSLDPSVAMIIAPCSAIHTFFMRFAVDAVFVDRAGLVLKVVSRLKPWRMAAALRAYAVIELNAGNLARSEGVTRGDRLYLE